MTARPHHLASVLLLALALVLLAQTCALRRADGQRAAAGAARAQEREAQRAHIAGLELETRRLRGALTALERRPERALALAVEGELETGVLSLLNRDRAALGRSPLSWDEQLAFLARWRASDLHTRNYYSHTFPEGGNIGSLLASYGGLNTLVGENIFSCASWLQCGAVDLHRVFVESPGHKNNQERAEYTHFAAGVSVSPEGDTFVVELFSNQSFGYQAPRP